MVRPQQSKSGNLFFFLLFLAQPMAYCGITSKREPLYIQRSRCRNWLTIPAQAQGTAGINQVLNSSLLILK